MCAFKIIRSWPRITILILTCVAGFAVALVLADRGRTAPATQRFIGWTNMPQGLHAMVEIRNTSTDNIGLFGYCERRGEGIVRRVVDLAPGSIRIRPNESEVCRVPGPESAQGDFQITFHLVTPMSLKHELAETLDEILSMVHLKIPRLKEFYEDKNRWSIVCDVPAAPAE